MGALPQGGELNEASPEDRGLDIAAEDARLTGAW
jgi:hypothetical protein